ncbi:MAG: NfeD family protein [Candidatus Promineifilaceae bacterium]
MRRVGLISGLLLALLAAAALVPAAAGQGRAVLVAQMDGPVTQAMAGYFERAIQAAEAAESEALVIVLDTPGGELGVTLQIVQAFRNAEVPVIVFIGPAGAQAASAGSVILAAAHAAGMAPETVVGAASPVDSSGGDIGDTLLRKVTEDLKATMRNLTGRRGPEAVTLAEAMIENAKAVTADEALEAGFIDAVAASVPQLLEELDGLEVEVGGQTEILETAEAAQEPFDASAIEDLLHALSNPLLVGLLLTVGIQAILIELSSPGGWVAGFLGLISLGLALYGLGTLPANWLGLGLVILAFGLFILEIKTGAATGALAVAGVLSLLAGLLVLFNSPGTPAFARISLAAAAGISVVSSLFFLLLVGKALAAQNRPAITGREGMLGEIGTVRVPFQPAGPEGGAYFGKVLVRGELWRAAADAPIPAGERVVVAGMDGFTLRVQRLA